MFSAINNFFTVLKSANDKYITDAKKLTCSCLDWKENRYQYTTDDPRRLCKHIVKRLDLNALPKTIKHFRESIEYYQSHDKGFNDFDFDKIIYLPQNDLKVFGFENLFHSIWMNVYDNEGHRYGFLINAHSFEFIWAKQKKPIGYEEVEDYFSHPSMTLPSRLQEYEKNELIFYMKAIIPRKKDSSFRIEEAHQYIPSPSGIYYLVDESNKNINNRIAHEIRWVVVKHDVMIIEEYDGKEYSIARNLEKVKLIEENIKLKEEQERLQREADAIKRKQEYEQELLEKRVKAVDKGYLFLVKDSLYREAIMISNRDQDAQYTEYLDATEKISLEYMSTKELLIGSKINLTLLQFNNILKNIGVINKVKGLNLDDWIVINDGLKFGINIEKSSQYFSETIPDWYQIKTIHPIILELLDLEDRQNVRMTKVLWKKNKSLELIELINRSIESDFHQNTMPIKSKRQLERKLWLESVQCPSCNSKNLHKKSKRDYNYGTVQRYQCMDCRKIFQEPVKENSTYS